MPRVKKIPSSKKNRYGREREENSPFQSGHYELNQRPQIFDERNPIKWEDVIKVRMGGPWMFPIRLLAAPETI